MATRSNAYDTLGKNLDLIKMINKHFDDTIENKIAKGNVDGIDSAATDFKAINTLSYEVQLQYEQLRSDFEQKRISQAFYVDHLKKLKAFLTERDGKFSNKHLDTSAIAQEVNRFI